MKKDNMKENELDNEKEDLLEVSEEKLTETKDEAVSEKSNDSTNEKDEKDHSFIKALLANLLDQLIMLACSGIILLLFDFLIRRIGYMVAIPERVLLVIYFILNCIYEPIIQRTKLKKSFGKKILNLK